MHLDLPGGRAALRTLDDKGKNCEPRRVAERTQLLRMVFQLGRHGLFLTNSK